MEITDATIDRMALELIDELELWEIGLGDNNDDKTMTLGYISGINAMANYLKRELKREQKKIDLSQE